MYTAYEEMPSTSRVWVYQASTPLTDKQVDTLNNAIKAFCGEWEAHKQPVKACGAVLHGLFLLLIADEAYHEVSGCSIDSSVRFVKNAGEQTGIDFFNRLNVAVFMNDHWQLIPQNRVKQMLAAGEIQASDRVFNYQVATKSQLEQEFSVPLSESWLSRYLPQPA